jgi:hypothetical protein
MEYKIETIALKVVEVLAYEGLQFLLNIERGLDSYFLTYLHSVKTYETRFAVEISKKDIPDIKKDLIKYNDLLKTSEYIYVFNIDIFDGHVVNTFKIPQNKFNSLNF